MPPASLLRHNPPNPPSFLRPHSDPTILSARPVKVKPIGATPLGRWPVRPLTAAFKFASARSQYPPPSPPPFRSLGSTAGPSSDLLRTLRRTEGVCRLAGTARGRQPTRRRIARLAHSEQAIAPPPRIAGAYAGPQRRPAHRHTRTH